MTKPIQRTFYAISYPCGLAVNANTGDRYGTYYSFPTKALRDRWVDGGGGYRTAKDWREAIPASDPEIRRAVRESEESGYDVIEKGPQGLPWLRYIVVTDDRSGAEAIEEVREQGFDFDGAVVKLEENEVSEWFNRNSARRRVNDPEQAESLLNEEWQWLPTLVL